MRPADFERRFRAALGFLNEGDLLAADAACLALRQMSPDDPAVLQLHASVALRAGRPGDAQAAIRQFLLQHADHVPALLLGARAALALDTPHEAVPLLRRALAQGDRAEAAFLLCHALLAIEDGTLEAAMAVASRCGGHAGEWQRLGLALRGAGRLPQAREALQKATSLDPDRAGAWFALGLTHQDLGEEAKAAAAYEAALAVQPEFAEAAVNLGVARQALGDMAAAMQAYRRAVTIRSDTLGRVAQALTAARTGTLFLDPVVLRRELGA